jgi:phosphoserine phosphatase
VTLRTAVLLAAGWGDADAVRAALSVIDGRRNGARSFEATVRTAYALFAQALANVPHSALAEAARRAWRQQRHELFEFVAPLTAEFVRRGYVVALISGSPHEVVAAAAADLGIPHSFGVRLATENGRCLAEVERAPGLPGGKLRCLSELRDRQPVALSRSLAMGNDPSDIEVLDAVGTGVAFEPSKELEAVARTRGWHLANRATVHDLCLRLITQPDDRDAPTMRNEHEH